MSNVSSVPALAARLPEDGVIPSAAGTMAAPGLAPDSGITTDTGDLAPRPRTYARYGTPLACLAATSNVRNVVAQMPAARLTLTAGFTLPAADTLPAAAIAVARTCGAHFTADKTSKATLPDLFTLALWEMNDTLAQATLAQLVAQENTSEGRGNRLLWGIKQYLAALPARVGAAEAAVAQIDGMSKASLDLRVEAHQTLVDFGSSSADWPLVARQGRQLITLAQDSLSQARLDVLWKTYKALLTVAWLEYPDSVIAVTARLRTQFSQPAVQQVLVAECRERDAIKHELCAVQDSSSTNIPVTLPITDTTSLTVLAAAALGANMHAPRSLPPLRSDFWFPAPGGGGDSLHPASFGHVTLIYHVSDGPGAQSCFEGCPAWMMRQLQALLQRYGAEIAVTVLVDAAAGYTVMETPAPSEGVARSYQWLFQTYWGLPVTVVVRIRPVTKHASPPDGRIEYANFPPYNDAYDASWLVQVTNRAGESIYETESLQTNAERMRLAQVVAQQEARK